MLTFSENLFYTYRKYLELKSIEFDDIKFIDNVNYVFYISIVWTHQADTIPEMLNKILQPPTIYKVTNLRDVHIYSIKLDVDTNCLSKQGKGYIFWNLNEPQPDFNFSYLEFSKSSYKEDWFVHMGLTVD